MSKTDRRTGEAGDLPVRMELRTRRAPGQKSGGLEKLAGDDDLSPAGAPLCGAIRGECGVRFLSALLAVGCAAIFWISPHAQSRRAGQALAAPGGLRSGSFKPARLRPETPADAAARSSMAALRYQPP